MLPWSILSVLLQCLPVHRGTANPAQLLPWPCPQRPQHSLGLKSCSKPQHTRQAGGGAVSRAAFPCRGLKSHKTWTAGWVHTSGMSPGGARTSRKLLWIPSGSPPSAASWDPFPACPRNLFIPRIQGSVCKWELPPVSTPKARACLQGDTKHPSPALLTASRALEELEFTPQTRTCSLF